MRKVFAVIGLVLALAIVVSAAQRMPTSFEYVKDGAGERVCESGLMLTYKDYTTLPSHDAAHKDLREFYLPKERRPFAASVVEFGENGKEILFVAVYVDKDRDGYMDEQAVGVEEIWDRYGAGVCEVADSLKK